MARRDLLATAVGLAVAAAVFAVMFWIVDAGAVFGEMRNADLRLLLVVAGLILLWNVSWGIALWNVLRGLDVHVPIQLAMLIHAAAAFANHVTPFGQAGGEPVTALLLTRTTDTEYEVSLASIASLDAINVVPSLVFAAVGALYFLLAEGQGTELGTLPIVVLGAAILLPTISLATWRYRRRLGGIVRGPARAVAERLVGPVPRLTPTHLDGVGERVTGFVAAIERLAGNRGRLAAALSFSALGWALQSVGLWVTFLALDVHVPLYVAFFVIPLGRVGSAFPTPGGLGGTEAINVALLAVLTSAGAATITAAVTIHSVGGYLLTTSVGGAAASALLVRE
ncbi:lysylphosphatidylglycerol synthase transmembrane domain-containing protein [Salinarchaeum chitinilyticum]